MPLLRGAAPPEKGYVLFETGYGPSGLPHIGTFGEVARTSMVRHAFQVLTGNTIPTRLVAFSDDMDGLRKVPEGVPNQEMLREDLHLSLTRVRDPFGTHDSFGAHNNAELRRFLDAFGFEYEFLSATDCYRSGRFDETLLKALEAFDARRVAGRILGQGDIVALVEKASQDLDQAKAEKMARKLAKGQFDLDDLAGQLQQMKRMGGMGGILGMMPGMKKAQAQLAQSGMDDKILVRMEAIIDSMTPKERAKPELLAPAGTLKTMRYAFAYGADAVYAGQPRYSLRVRNNEFDHANLALDAMEKRAAK